MEQIIVVASLLLLSQTTSSASVFDVVGSSFSSLVNDQEEVFHTVIGSKEGYEERHYPSRVWVCKLHSGELTSSAQQAAFLSLFDYLSGHNNASLTMPMAIPASVYAPAAQNSSSEGTQVFEACFYPGQERQDNTPVPTIDELYLKTRPAMTIFTRRFGGYADTEEEWRAETNSLQTLLDAAGESTVKHHYFWNAYDSPIKFWSRRNEVWVIKKE